jgi:hypothetical protein
VTKKEGHRHLNVLDSFKSRSTLEPPVSVRYACGVKSRDVVYDVVVGFFEVMVQAVSAAARRDLDKLPRRILAAVIEFAFGDLAREPRRVGKPLGGELADSTALDEAPTASSIASTRNEREDLSQKSLPMVTALKATEQRSVMMTN